MPPAQPGDSNIVAVVCPHAGYVYSGPVAAHSYLQVSTLTHPELIIVVGPNHYGIGSGVSTYKEGEWETPLGSLRVDSQAAARLVSEAGIVDFDPAAQSMEHSIEVQLPFLQKLYRGVPFVPVCLNFQDPETAKTVGQAIASIVAGRRAVLVASSDLTHYEPAVAAKEKDSKLLSHVENMDTDGFFSTLERLQVSACGYGAIATVMEAAKGLGMKQGTILKYATSGDTTGDNAQVVGYPAVRFL